ncbi:hypothetical protein GTCCBUS3UF5_3850 [Geobacillus thermoleovorans CCB_US3_UF5]|uniref:Uncharacterized protein n=1 Tax=Geobacillus thermoleovorans CCB_US3_UF5 TaxID=1111068 RepID=A0ABN3ZQ51_GEOTH|nr:hypothetical protein GTCCBUS3UF5_3850 [Geobacillus thermoleovorans CCB_US3_UF5]
MDFFQQKLDKLSFVYSGEKTFMTGRRSHFSMRGLKML